MRSINLTLLAAAALVLSAAAGAQDDPGARCVASARQPASDPRAGTFADLALREHRAFGGQTLDAYGRLVRAGFPEAEFDRLPGDPQPPWRRVLGYWQALDSDEPGAVRADPAPAAQRRLLHGAIAESTAARLQGLGVGPDAGLLPHEARALAAAVDRAAVIDTPWSAVFVSALAREAGLSGDEFVLSDAHADYVAGAWDAVQAEAHGLMHPSAVRACDIASTTPRTGDLVCHTRSSAAAYQGFDALRAAIAERKQSGGPLPMHCDIVVRADAQTVDVVGGNVLQSVTLRQLALGSGSPPRLHASYITGQCTGGDCPDRYMSTQPWAVVLQWRN